MRENAAPARPHSRCLSGADRHEDVHGAGRFILLPLDRGASRNDRRPVVMKHDLLDVVQDVRPRDIVVGGDERTPRRCEALYREPPALDDPS